MGKFEKVILFFVLMILIGELFFSFFSLKYIEYYDQPPESGDETWALDFALSSLEKKEPQSIVWLGYKGNDYGFITPWPYIFIYGIPMLIKGDIDIYWGRLVSFIFSVVVLIFLFFFFKFLLKNNFYNSLLLVSLPLLNYNFLYASHSCRGEILICTGVAFLFILNSFLEGNREASLLRGIFSGIFFMGLIGLPIILFLALTEEFYGFFASKNTNLKKFLLGFFSLIGLICLINYPYAKNMNSPLNFKELFLSIPLINLFITNDFSYYFKKIIFDRFLLLVKSMGWEILIILFSLFILRKRMHSLKNYYKANIIFISLLICYFLIYPKIREIYLSFFYIAILCILGMICKENIKTYKILLPCLLGINLLSFRSIWFDYIRNKSRYEVFYSNQKSIAEEVVNYFQDREEKPLVMGGVMFYQYLDRNNYLTYRCYDRYFHEKGRFNVETLKKFLQYNKIDYWLFTDIDNNFFSEKCRGWNFFFKESLRNGNFKPVLVFTKKLFYFDKFSEKAILFEVNF